jgi:hypothetical protein
VSSAAPYHVDAVDPALPATLDESDHLTVSVTFTPDAAQTSDGELVVTGHGDDADDLPTAYRYTLSGTGTQEGVAASPATLDFGDVRVGESGQLGVTLRNTGVQDATVTAADGPAPPFTASLPATGYVLPAQQTVSVTVRYTPTASGTDDGSFTLTTSNGPVSVHLTGRAETGAPKLSVPASLDFGNVAPGTSTELGLRVANTGTTTITVTKAAPPAAPFAVEAPLSEGQRIAPGDSLTVFVKVRPTSARPVRDVYVVSSDDGTGGHRVAVTVNTRPWIGGIRAPLGCLDILSARQANGTPAVSYPCNGTPAQRFGWGADGSLRMGGPTSRWCLDVPRAATAIGTRLQLYTCNGTAAQVWQWDAAGRLVNPHSHRCIDVLGHSRVKNTRLVLAACSATPSQKWDASPLASARGYVGSALAAAGQLCLTDPGGSAAAGAAVTIDVCGGTSQVVTRNRASLRLAGECLTVADPHARPGAGVWLEPCSGAATQVWQAGAKGRLANPATNTCLDVPAGATRPGTALQVWRCNGTRAQGWTLP